MKLHQLVAVLSMFLVWLPAHGSECPVTIPTMEDRGPLFLQSPPLNSRSKVWHGSSALAATIVVQSCIVQGSCFYAENATLYLTDHKCRVISIGYPISRKN